MAELSVCQRIKFKVLVIVFKAKCGTGPTYLQELIQPYRQGRELRSASHHLVNVPFTKSTVIIPPSHRRAVPLRCFGQNHHYCSDTASSFHSFPLPVTHVFFFAVLLRNQGGITAEPLRCHCEHGDPIELSLRFNCGTTAIIGGRTTVIAAALRGQ